MRAFVVYTALFGDYDVLYDIPIEYTKYCDFICFTDNIRLNVKNWIIRYVDSSFMSPVFLNRRYKMLPHLYLTEYHSSLYIDSNIIIKSNPIDLYYKYLTKYDILFPHHFKRKCVYDEFIECIKLGKINIFLGMRQIITYKRNGMPFNFGLSENGIILRNHNKHNVIQIMNLWWDEYLKYPYRDQISLPYALYKLNMRYNFIEESCRNENIYFVYTCHKNDYNYNIFKKCYKKILILFRKYFLCSVIKVLIKYVI
ncbi:MAG: DUF616 domain-containing protein [Thermaceae bacterium]|nr:DUF616 domain-containing protein [Thermaceae bacterium]